MSFSSETRERFTIILALSSDVYRANGIIKNFQEFLTNLFKPLFEATLDPTSHPDLFRFMHHLTGFDSVDDETKPEKPILTADMPHPAEWNNKDNPPYVYYLVLIIRESVSFVLMVFVLVLHVREHSDLESAAQVSRRTVMMTLARRFISRARGLNTFQFRPHCGEAGAVTHLVAAYMVAENISHGLLLRKVNLRLKKCRWHSVDLYLDTGVTVSILFVSDRYCYVAIE